MKINPIPEEEKNPKYPADSELSDRIREVQFTGGMIPEPPRPKRPQRLGGMALDADKIYDYYPEKKKKP